ncbi:MAG: hypothetical protein R3338_04035 [Thermoanaerobaculia bacterium]|nr:hypothetical protein [Thermoanaerobaculia bacterium]
MTTGGWILLGVSLTFVWSLLIWCYTKILRGHTDVEEGPDLL